MVTFSRLPYWNPGEMLLPGGITWDRKDRLHKETGLEDPQRGMSPSELLLLELSVLMPEGKWAPFKKTDCREMPCWFCSANATLG